MRNYPILTTKLNRPRCFQTIFRRPRLEELLEKNLNKVATLIIAGAGYGKSTLVSEWIKDKKHVWLSCDADMNKLEILISYMIHGFQKEDIHNFPETTRLLSSPNQYSEELLKNTFFSEGNSISQKIILVIDDFHLLDSLQILNLLKFFLNNPPPNIHVMFLTRHDPVFGLSKHRLNNVFNEVRMKELNLSEIELKQYAHTNFNLKLTNEHIDTLINKTEGWFLGVTQLLSASAELHIPLDSNNNVLKLDQFNHYFAEEVIQRQSENHRKVLFVCSLFYQFSKELIEYIITKIEPEFPVNEIPAALMNKNNFTISLDSSNSWLRFHHLFHEALETYFQNHPYTKQREKCLQFGGEWLLENKFYEDGIQKTIESGNISLAVKHLQCYRYELLNTDQYTRLGHILSLFPDVEQKNNIELILIQAILLENQGKYEALAELLNNCQEIVKKGELSNQQLGEYKMWQALLLFFSGEYSESLRFVDLSLELMSDYAHSLITFAFAYKAMALNAINKKDEALSCLSNKLDALHKNQFQSIVRILVSKAVIYSLHSDLRNQQFILPQIIEISDQHNFYETLGMGLYFQIETNYRTGNHGQCDALFNKSHEIRYLMRPVWYAYLLGLKIYFSLHQNDNSLKEAIHQLKAFAKEQNAENINQFQNALLTEVALRDGNYTKAHQLHQQTNYHLYPPIFYYYLPQITELKALLYTSKDGNFDAFFSASENLWKYGRARQHQNLLLKLNILTSIASYMQDNTNDAAKYMSAALSISEATGDRFVYKEFSDHVHEILVYMQKKDVSSPCLQHILSLFEVSTHKKNKEDLELKERDIKLLNFVAKGFTNAQIADAMFLSPESVKKYLYDIYQDLGVKNRIQAIIMAKEMGVIAPK